MLPYFILGEDAYINIWDFLDSNVAHMHTIVTLGLVGKIDGVLPIMDGNVSALFYSPLVPVSIQELLYLLLPTYWAIVGNVLFVKVFAFLGMYLLTSNYIVRDKLSSFLVSVAFMFIPFYVDYGLSSAGVPLFLYAVLNLENCKKQGLSLLIITFFACNSSLNLVGVFICLLWGGWILYLCCENKQIPKWHFIGICLMVTVYLFSNFSVLKDYFFPTDFVSHRVEFFRVPPYSEALEHSIHLLKGSHPHVGNFYVTPLIIMCLAILLVFYKQFGSAKNYVLGLLSLMILIILGSFAPHIPMTFFKAFDFTRFMFLFPTCFFILVAKTYSFLVNKTKTGNDKSVTILLFLIMLLCAIFCFTYKLAIVFAVLAILVYVIIGRRNLKYLLCFFYFFITIQSTLTSDKELVENLPRLAGRNNLEKPSFRQFYDESLFEQIKHEQNINSDYTCKVVSVGMHPSIAEYNKFYTLDSYMQSYSLDYKHKFHKLIAKELVKDDDLRDYFENWGSRCYTFSAELEYEKGRIYGKQENKQIKNFEIDVNYLKQMGGQYILSAVEICNYKDLNLTYIKSYTTPQSFFNIRVYKVQ